MGFVCKECGYRFSKKADSCPYCGEKRIEKEQDAEELLNETEPKFE